MEDFFRKDGKRDRFVGCEGRGRWGCVKGPGMSRREGEVKRERERELVGMQK